MILCQHPVSLCHLPSYLLLYRLWRPVFLGVVQANASDDELEKNFVIRHLYVRCLYLLQHHNKKMLFPKHILSQESSQLASLLNIL